MKLFAVCLVLIFATTLLGADAASISKEPPASILPISSESLVRVNSTNQAFDFFRPWSKKAPFFRRGLGVVLPGGQVLVTAELVANRTYVELEKADSAEKSPAEIAVVDYDCNLALIKPSDSTFLKEAKALQLDSGARVGDRASILQLESNGLIADTPGVITTITVAGYPLDHLALLTYRISAPLQNREGSFTVPAVRNGRLLGLLMRYDGRSQTADVIPAPVISHFLEDAQRESYPGFPRAGLVFASTRDPQFRRYIGLRENGGVYITEVRPGSAAEKAGLRKGDVILAVANKPIDQDGNYEEPGIGRIPFSHLTNTLVHVDDVVDFKILRNGNQQTVPVKVGPIDDEQSISKPYEFDRQPRYLILGGLVFQELSRPYLEEWGANWTKDAPQRLVYLDAYQNELSPGRGKIVFLSQVLPTLNSLGYEGLEHLVVSKVNGMPVKNLNELAKAAASPKDGFHKIEFEEDPGLIYLDAAEIEKNKGQLMQDYSIPALENLD
jgi:S1-C subfamily serine protease